MCVLSSVSANSLDITWLMWRLDWKTPCTLMCVLSSVSANSLVGSIMHVKNKNSIKVFMYVWTNRKQALALLVVSSWLTDSVKFVWEIIRLAVLFTEWLVYNYKIANSKSLPLYKQKCIAHFGKEPFFHENHKRFLILSETCHLIEFHFISFIISQGRNNHKHNSKKTIRENYVTHVHDEKKINVTKCWQHPCRITKMQTKSQSSGSSQVKFWLKFSMYTF